MSQDRPERNESTIHVSFEGGKYDELGESEDRSLSRKITMVPRRREDNKDATGRRGPHSNENNDDNDNDDATGS